MAQPLGQVGDQATYTHGHHESVLRSHSWRTAQNSAAFLLPHLKAGMHILDCGCGPGTITADLAAIVTPSGKVVGLEYEPSVLVQARAVAKDRGVEGHTEFVIGDIHALDFPDDTFDVVFAHQVLQHVTDPISALREMRRVVKKGGIVAARDADYDTFTHYPPVEGLEEWKKLFISVAKDNGGEPNAGRMLHAFARQAGFTPSSVDNSVGVWCYSTEEEIKWWSELWAERTLKSAFAASAIKQGKADEEKLAQISGYWLDWGSKEDAYFFVPNGEIICHK